MKRKSALILSFLLVLSLLAGCSATPAKTDAFVKPENYEAVVQVAINPTVNLYLDDIYTVLAVEYVNADAETAYKAKEAELVGKSIDDCAKIIVDQAVNGGYLTENNNGITITVTETKGASRQEDVLAQAEEGFLIAVKPVTILPIVIYTPQRSTTVTDRANTTTLGDHVTTTVADVTTTAGKATTSTTTITTTGSTTKKPVVTTTTTQAPTTKKTTTQKPTTAAPTTAALQILDPSLVKQSVEYKGTPKEVPSGLATPMLLFEDDICVVMVYDHVLEPEEEGIPPFEFNGKIYYGQGAGMSPLPFEVKDKVVHVLDNDKVILKVVLQSDGTLRITESKYEHFAAGDILVLAA